MQSYNKEGKGDIEKEFDEYISNISKIDIQVFPSCFVKRLSKTEYRKTSLFSLGFYINEIIDEDRK